MADVRALGVFQKRVKELLGSLLEVLLDEITEVYRDCLTERMRTIHCERCACNQKKSDNNKAHEDEEVIVMSEDSQPMMSFQCRAADCDPSVLTEPLEQKDVQQVISKDQTSDRESSNADHHPDSLDSERDVKEENRDISLTNDEKAARETAHLKESQACQTLIEINGAKPGDNPITPFQQEDLCLSGFSSVGRDTASPQSQTQDGHLLLPLRPCFVQLQKFKILQRPISQSRQLHVCGICSRVFIYKQTLRRHKRFHTGEKPHGCSLCTKKFILRKTLRVHMTAHFKRPYSCTQCEKRFRHRRKLRIHWRHHAGESPFVCKLCRKSCKTLKSLDRHLAHVNHDNI